MKKITVGFISFENHVAVAEQEENENNSHDTVSAERTSQSPEEPQTAEGEAETAKEATEEQK